MDIYFTPRERQAMHQHLAVNGFCSMLRNLKQSESDSVLEIAGVLGMSMAQVNKLKRKGLSKAQAKQLLPYARLRGLTLGLHQLYPTSAVIDHWLYACWNRDKSSSMNKKMFDGWEAPLGEQFRMGSLGKRGVHDV